ncbi:autotransporter outer membrane beta-barrel domain-containing protein [Glaesserella parasuis]|uniref:Autotransporter outer membrane beta-barrel domain-containing protein n=7 Tax=Glaesserella parasuis TaxID=738 RepID=A0AAX1M6U9_GLAPU|nr:autotransporter outer membrane beta-barrel domain-containing protein [Glaesserella parasuis]MDE4032843.1 autotransporter outer membrane beta-barrel domain-containing protein [Glaesserella parasuis]MDO9647232.1 autotransporter outer membrane beta-barrel domain-containing protein [Glaesserella parasuis]MDP0394608.1 autotransporter outer membrane beta-barrel domain-containing protein [Glaesserella parasuis]MDP0480020.1 autotransporter outer membrane beta-barrel domain-containing protein [Glaess
MKPYLSKIVIATLFSSSVQVVEAQTYWASGVNQNSGWTADLQYPNQCWGAVAGNTLGWWKSRVKAQVEFNEDTPKDSKAISGWIYKTYPHIQGGLQPYRGMEYFFSRFASGVKLYEEHNKKTYYESERGPTKISGGPFWTERYDSDAKLVTKSLIDNFKTGNVVAALTSQHHTVTLWGIEVDGDGKIKKGWISDSVKDKAGNLKMVEVVGNYAKDNKGNDIFRFLYSYAVDGGRMYVTDLYDIYSITYLSIDEARNNGTYKDTSNREDCRLSLAPGVSGSFCSINSTATNTTKVENVSTTNNNSTNLPTKVENSGYSNQVINAASASDDTVSSASENNDSVNTPENIENSNGVDIGNNSTVSSANVENSSNEVSVINTPNTSSLPNDQGTKKIIVDNSESNAKDPIISKATESLTKEINSYPELSFITKNMGDVTFYIVQKDGVDIALINPKTEQSLVSNKGLVIYDFKQDQNGNIHITKSPNQAAIKEANELTSLHTDLNHVEMNNLNKRMGELRGIDANAGVWARVLGGKGSSDSYKHKFTHIQTGFDKQSHLSNAELFTGVTVTHTSTDIEGKIGSTNGDVKSIGAGVYATALFDNGFYLDTIAKYVKNNHKFDYAFKEMKLDFKSQRYNTHSFYLGGEVGYRFNLGSGYVEPQAEVIYVKNSQANLADNGHKLTIKVSNGLVGRLGVNAGKTFEIGQSKATAWAGIGYQWDIAKRNEILVDGISASNSKKDARMLMDLGLNIRANDKLSIGLSLEGSAFGKYNTDLSVNSNVRYSF